MRRGGLERLADRSHRPVSCPYQMAAAVEVRLVELRQLHPGWGADRLRYRLGREGFDPLPSWAAISRALVRLGLVSSRRARQRARQYRRWERGRPMELWQMDVVGGVMLDDGRELKAVTAIDDHSRGGRGWAWWPAPPPGRCASYSRGCSRGSGCRRRS